jgi:hypothetical protein
MIESLQIYRDISELNKRVFIIVKNFPENTNSLWEQEFKMFV